MKLDKILILWIFFILHSINLCSQSSFYSEYGKNRIQYKSVKWSIIYSNNFEVYYNNNEKDLADLASKYLENNFREMTSLVGHQPIKKTKVFIFNSPSELIQSNIGINNKDLFLSTNLVQNNSIQFEIAFSNTKEIFKQKLKYKFLKVIINDLMKGNNGFSDRFGKASFSSVPIWFIDGASRYLAYGWDLKMDNVIRDYFLTKDLKKIKNITDKNPEMIGQSIWNYISIYYGKNIISNILNLTKIIRNPEKAIASSLGKSFNEVMGEWQNYYLLSINSYNEQYSKLNDNYLINFKKKYSNITDLKISPNNESILFSSKNKNGITLSILEKSSNKINTISKVINTSKNNNFYSTWINDHKIGYLKMINGINNIIIYDIINKQKTYKPIPNFKNVNGFSFNYTTNLIALSGTINSNNNLYLLSTYKNSIKQLTNNISDDIQPKFFPKSNSIVFSSNRTHNKIDSVMSQILNYNNLFIYNLDTTKNYLHQITKTISDDINALPISRNEIIYMSDLKGINTLYKYEISNNTFKQVTDYYSNILNYDYNIKEKSLALSILKGGKIKTYDIKNYNVEKTIFTPKTSRTIYYDKQKISEIKAEKKIESTLNKNFQSTDDFKFKDDKKQVSSILNNINNFQNESRDSGPINYSYSFIKNNFNSFIKIDPLEKYGSQIETDFIDIFEDHKLYARAFVPFTSIKSSDIFTEYSYLKKRIDFKISYNRKIYFAEDKENFLYHKYSLNEFNFKTIYPISPILRFEISGFLSNTEFSDLDYRVLNTTPPPFLYYNKTKYIGTISNIIYDNSKKIGMNLEEGTKLKLSLKNYSSLKNSSKNFRNFSVDLMHHQKIFNNIILSSRIFYGGSFGENAKKYLLGGVQNSVFSSTNNDNNSDNPLAIYSGIDNSSILFSEFIDLRCFDFNKFYGEKVLLLSSEIRIPIIKSLFNNNATSEFLNNLQIIGFFDLGSSWNDNSPFSSKSDVNTWIIKEPGSVFQAEIENSKNPWLASYGFGLRSLIMDYYIKLDIAKPIEDYKTGNSKIHFSIGYSF